MANTKVAPETVLFVTETGCSNDCTRTITINKGLSLPCKEWSNEDSLLLRERMIVDNQLFASGLVRRVEASNLGNSRRILKHGIDVGAIRTQDSGAPAVNECKTVFDGIQMKDFEKKFYVVNTSKNIKLCTKDFIGTKWQDMVSNRLSDYNAEGFADTDMADVIIAGIMDKYKMFLPKFILLAACGSAGEDMHGDDGIFAKAYYASKGQYFHTISYDFTAVDTDFPDTYIQALAGGAKYDATPSDFATIGQYLLNFVEWLNSLKEVDYPLFNASVDLGTFVVTVASNYATRFIDLKVVLNTGTVVDWSCVTENGEELPYTQYQKPMMINDVPLLFQYEAINETNFAQKFKTYKKEFSLHLSRNGFEDITDADILIGIDPDLLLERQAQTQDEIIAGNFNTDFMNQIGLQITQFRPLNALKGTGNFFMTIRENLLLLDDSANFLVEMGNRSNFRIKEGCNDGEVEILSSLPPVGSEVEQWGAFAANLEGSPFVINNKLDQREPCEAARLNLICYDEDVKNSCALPATCTIYSTITSTATYDDGTDETTISILVDATSSNEGSIDYDINWSLSDGTGSNSNVNAFTITLPGDQTNSGLVLNITGALTAEACISYLSFTERFGEGDGFFECAASGDITPSVTPMQSQLTLNYTIDGVNYQVPFVNQSLEFGTPGDHTAIEAEIEAILDGVDAEITIDGLVYTLTITNLPSFVTAVSLYSDESTQTLTLTIEC